LSWTASFSQPFLRVLIPSAGAAYGLQALVAIPSVLVASERFYDISGSLTFITATLLSMYLPIMQTRAVAAMTATIPKPGYPRILGFLGSALGQNDFSVRKLAVNAAVIVWAMRCKFAPPVSFHISSCARLRQPASPTCCGDRKASAWSTEREPPHISLRVHSVESRAVLRL
jgi:hypothetical protein